MKVTFETEDAEEARLLMKAEEISLAAWRLREELRSQVKYGNHPKDAQAAWEAAYAAFYKHFEDLVE